MKSKFSSLIAIIVLISLGCASSPDKRSCEAHPKSLNANPEITIDMAYYGETKPTGKSVLIIPPTGGTNYIDRRYAVNLCEAGFDVFILNSWSNQEFETIQPDLHQKFYSRSQLAIGEVLKTVPPGFVGILGTSVGGLHASIAVQTEARIQAAFFIVTGVPLMNVIMESDQIAMVELRKARYEKLGYKTDAYLLEVIQKAFTLEPQQLGNHFKGKNIGMSIALNDTTIPTSLQLNLKEFFQPQKVITYDSSHFWGIAKTWLFNTSDIVDFFERSAQVKNSDYAKR